MGKPTGFIEFSYRKQPYRPIGERVRDWTQVMVPYPADELQRQAARCMDCGIPFCHQGCPLGNIIPDWNDLAYRGLWREAIDRLHATNNFPEFTGSLCPAPCEGSCVLGINDDPVAIRAIELVIIEHAFEQGWVRPEPPAERTGKKAAIVGSGPAGLAAAQQLNRAGHLVTVYERDDRIGGLLRYGIPEFKMEKRVLDRRLEQMEQEGILFRVNANIGTNVMADELRSEYDAVLLAGGVSVPRDLKVPGRELRGIHFAMDYLTLQNRRCAGDAIPDEEFITAGGKRVVIIGGGDTGADCLGTANRQGALSIRQFEIMPRPPDRRAPDNPWPLWPNILRTYSAHEEGVIREFSISTTAFSGENGRVGKLHGHRIEMVRNGSKIDFRPLPGTEFAIEADMVLLAMGFLGPERNGVFEQFGVKMTERGNVWRDENWMTSVPGVFTAGDMQRGQSLIVWAIAEGRSAARGIDRYLMGRSDLPSPLS